ncbi:MULTISPECIES: VOC family protein [Halococcus]|uniref:Glyoxalase/bleomycin resistance protein/dioxygenase n=1 Tax=Halococcus salifodinae DSM 8989 TaxID=1227456 RepID=M0N3U4_9EURY|nr:MULTISPECIES: VOC family protein [Halococcus]EMA52521.1 glyoxalase/bleomycin resistance protein/dioxygenase [Halococcus salifodinae DSM 8989]
MITTIEWLALEVKYLDRASAFYRDHLDLDTVVERDDEIALAVGDTDFVLRRPAALPRGGLHTHYALSIPAAEYDAWYDRLAETFDLDEHTFGSARSLYFYDTEGNCVELGETEAAGTGVLGVFEVVLEVADLDRAEAFYTALGMEPVDRGGERRRVRLDAGPFALELWEPQLGIADARGGVHVDLGLGVDDPETTLERVEDRVSAVEPTDEGIRVRDPNGHVLTFV